MSRSTALASLPRGHRTNIAVDTRPRQVTGLYRHQPAMHLRRRCHHRPDLTDTSTGASLGIRLEVSSGHSHALQAYFVPPGEFPSSASNDWSLNGDSIGVSYLPSAFVGQPVGVDQVGDVWIGDIRATSYMTRYADLMYDTRTPPPPQI